MDFTGNDVATLMEYVRGPIDSHEHSLTFSFYQGPGNEFTDKFKGTLAYQEGTVVAAAVGIPSPSLPIRVPHPTSAKLVGIGKTDRGEEIHVTLSTDNLRRHPIVVVKGDLNVGPSDGPFTRVPGLEREYNFWYSEGGNRYTFDITLGAVDRSRFPKP